MLKDIVLTLAENIEVGNMIAISSKDYCYIVTAEKVTKVEPYFNEYTKKDQIEITTTSRISMLTKGQLIVSFVNA